LSSVADALRAATQRLRHSDTAALDAQLLLAQVTGRPRAWLLVRGAMPLGRAQRARFAALVARRAAGEPLAYIRRRQAFYDRDFHVSPATLIPRPETEMLLEAALAHTARRPTGVVADIGTGCGALAVIFAALRPGYRVIATDLSAAALTVARINAARHRVQPEFRLGDLLAPLLARQQKVDLLLANLPYIASDELPALAVSRYEPRLALDGGPDGLRLLRRLLQDLPRICHPQAPALLEIGADQGPAALALARALRPRQAQVLPDLAGHDRLLRLLY